jgi:hypothetical protein
MDARSESGDFISDRIRDDLASGGRSKLRRASGRATYSISGNSQAIPELFLAQDQVVGYLLKVIAEPDPDHFGGRSVK